MRRSRVWRSLAALLAAAPLVLPAVAVRAHPHVWIDNVTTLVFQQGRIVAIKLEWTFDDLFGDGIIEQFDTDKNKRFDAKELAALEKGAFANLREFEYFTHVSVDDKSVPTTTVAGFQARIVKGKLVYGFTVPVNAPVDPLKQRFVLGLYDPSFFVDIQVGGRASVKYEGADGMDCRTQLAENTKKPIYDGQVFPLEMFLTCRAP